MKWVASLLTTKQRSSEKYRQPAIETMTVREIQGHLAEIYGTEVSPDLISRVTDAVLDEVREWQTRPLDAVYPVVFFDAPRVKIRDDGMVKNKAVYVCARNPDGEKEVLVLWIEQTEGAKFWLKVINELKSRKDHAPANLAVLRRLALNIARAHPDTKTSLRGKLKRAAWDDSFLVDMLLNMR